MIYNDAPSAEYPDDVSKRDGPSTSAATRPKSVHRYQPMTLRDLAREIAAKSDEQIRHRLVREFVEEYSWEPAEIKCGLLNEQPSSTNDIRYDAFLAALAEHLAYHDGLAVPRWTQEGNRFLEQWWFPVTLPSVRTDALVHSPAAFRRRGIFIGTGALDHV